MAVLIKDIDKELYTKFKILAAKKGLKISEAFAEAIKKWLEEEKNLSETEKVRQENNATYRRLLPELIKDNEGKWILICEGEFIGIFPTRKAAVEEIKRKNLVDRYNLLSPITSQKRKVTLGLRRKLR
ncbi:MAG: hypothetical protein ACTSYD_02710 [Candidatus Heimdallarchaeaceae archaeon]